MFSTYHGRPAFNPCAGVADIPRTTGTWLMTHSRLAGKGRQEHPNPRLALEPL
jgi:hypothetical protein